MSELKSHKSNVNFESHSDQITLPTTYNFNPNSLEHIINLRVTYPNNPLIGYLNINAPDYFVIAETKLNDDFPTAQFLIENYEIKNRGDH